MALYDATLTEAERTRILAKSALFAPPPPCWRMEGANWSG